MYKWHKIAEDYQTTFISIFKCKTNEPNNLEVQVFNRKLSWMYTNMYSQVYHCSILYEKVKFKTLQVSNDWNTMQLSKVIVQFRGNVQNALKEKKKAGYKSSSIIIYEINILHALYQFFTAAGIRYHKMDSLNNQNLFCHSSGDQNCKIKVPAELVPSETHEGSICLSRPVSLAFKMPIFSLCLHSIYFCVQIPSSYKDTSHVGKAPTLMT